LRLNRFLRLRRNVFGCFALDDICFF
jgi:hypothetical protein